MQPFDSHNLDSLSLTPQSDLDRLVQQIRRTSDRVAGETWEQFYERTYYLALAEQARRKKRRPH